MARLRAKEKDEGKSASAPAEDDTVFGAPRRKEAAPQEQASKEQPQQSTAESSDTSMDLSSLTKSMKDLSGGQVNAQAELEKSDFILTENEKAPEYISDKDISQITTTAFKNQVDVPIAHQKSADQKLAQERTSLAEDDLFLQIREDPENIVLPVS